MKFESPFVNSLPGDLRSENQSRLVENACYSLANPTPVAAPKLVAYSEDLCEHLGVSADWIRSQEAAEVLGGNRLLEGMVPYAMCYGGHQFGNWAGQLGDGRAINLGEWRSPDGESWTWQLKGAGKTPYSRFADGLAVLRSSLREFACSEAMYHLGVPTTRALSLVLTGEQVVRDMFYDGNAKPEPGAIVCRIAPSFIRFGNFEIQSARGRTDLLQKLADFTIDHFFKEFGEQTHAGAQEERYADWFTEICRRTASMILDWMRVGFVHGVMNTDNMSILGLTIDYGPYGWIDNYDPNWTPNTTDFQHHRYAFGNQPQIGQWNLMQLANALYPLVNKVEPLQQGLNEYVDQMTGGYQRMMAGKLGLLIDDEALHSNTDDVNRCIELLNDVWQTIEIDMTIFFRLLSRLPAEYWSADHAPADARKLLEKTISPAFYRPEQLSQEGASKFWEWSDLYRSIGIQQARTPESRAISMNAVNPKYVLRNYLAQQAIESAEKGDYSALKELMSVLNNPYDEQIAYETKYFAKRPDWARTKPGCSTLSCSS